MKNKNPYLLLIAFIIFSLQLTTFETQAQASFSPATTVAVGGNPSSVISGDFNVDGIADLAVANYSNNNVSVFLGNGVGGFGSATNFAVGTHPYSIISADFNGDGKPDLAVANLGANYVSVLFNNGNGGFSASSYFVVGAGTYSITSTDLNGDNKADLVVAVHYLNQVSILLGDGIGGFTVNNIGVSGAPQAVTCKDFNGDGKTDLAIVYTFLSTVSVLLGDGIGGFGAATNFATGTDPSTVISADFNMDGKADLATANLNSNNVSILLGNGVGSFAAATDFAAGSAVSVITADFNSDGKEDLAVTNRISNVSVLIGGGNGGFGAAISFAVGVGPRSITSADFNGDSKTDLAVADFDGGNIYILLNDYLPISAPICLVTVDSTLTHNVVVWEKTNLDLAVIDSFEVYREITTNSYQRIGAVSKDSMSTFDDFDANPAATAYRYKLKNKNTQGVLSLFSDYHNTMYLTHAGADFSWTPYQIENNNPPVAAYKIYRDDNSTGNFQSIGTTTGNQLGFTDVNYASYPIASYYVEAVMTSGACHPSRSGYAASRSNVKHIGINGVQQLNNLSTITIYPNPATNTITITGITGKTLLRLFDVVGKIIIEKEVENDTSIDTSLLAEGSYTLLTSSKYGETFNKVVISR